MRSFHEYKEEKETGNILKTKGEGTPFGWELLIDIYEASGDLMQNDNKSKKAIEKFLLDLVKVLKMNVAGDVVCLMSDKNDIKEYPKHIGATAFIPVITSAITMHTIVPKKFAVIDVFSCKDFDAKLVDDFVKKSFNTEKVMTAFIRRGVEYNAEMPVKHRKV